MWEDLDLLNEEERGALMDVPRGLRDVIRVLRELEEGGDEIEQRSTEEGGCSEKRDQAWESEEDGDTMDREAGEISEESE